MPKPRSLAQNRVIHQLLHSNGIDAELKAEMVTRITKGRTAHTSAMHFHEANQLITELGGTALDSSRRTQQLHRQRAGVVQLITSEQQDKLVDLAMMRWGGDYPAPLKAMTQRILRKDRPQTTAEANKIIEAIKAMNARDQERSAA